MFDVLGDNGWSLLDNGTCCGKDYKWLFGWHENVCWRLWLDFDGRFGLYRNKTASSNHADWLWQDIENVHNDCGLLIYNLKEQDVNSGGSGCGCSASVVCSHILKQMNCGKLKRVLFVATGALMSPTSSKQGQPIPGIAHAVLLES